MGLYFAFDIGIASVGWAVVDREMGKIIECGSNLFEAAEASENVTRRGQRQLRRLHRRHKTRLSDFKKFWEMNVGKAPSEFNNNQLELRIKGLKEELTKDELYFVLYTMLKHRGISYLDEAADDSAKAGSDYQKGLIENQKALENKFPCEIQYERLEKYGEYRGNITVAIAGEVITYSNVFTTSAYRKEILAVLEEQKKYHAFITEDFCNGYIGIFKRKREYYEGPGNEKSRTDYGIYTTKKDENGDFIKEENLFDKLIGKCSVYPEEQRGAGASYTAQLFNALNDLNNLTINDRKLEEEEKRKIIEAYLSESTVAVGGKKVRKIIEKVIGEEIETFSGARINSKEEEIFHTLETYRALRKYLADNGVDISKYEKETLDDIAWILTLNTERDGIGDAFREKCPFISEDEIELFVSFRQKNGGMFSKWQSLSIRIMDELIPELYSQSKEQMTLLTEMGVFKSNIERYKGLTKIPANELLDEMYNPVVRRAVRICIEILNALLKKYGYPESIVIEMPRDKNSDDEKQRIKDEKKRNETELPNLESKIFKEYGIHINEKMYHNHKQLALKLKLWDEQSGICLYSGKPIEIQTLLDNPENFEIDHIIPRSISFDDSRSNKVLVYRTENQNKGNTTPYKYLSNVNREYGYREFKANVLALYAKKRISKKKFENLLDVRDITKMEVLQGFINRNLNDTRYASKVILNTITDFCRANDAETTVKVVRGSFTHQVRSKLRLEKSREESFAHHAEDAAIIAFSQMGFEVYKPLLFDVIDFETGEIIDENKAKDILSDDYYQQILYGKKWNDIKQEIETVKEKVKYWHKVDKKSNRMLSNQTIRGTRVINEKIYKVNKFSIRDDKGAAKFVEFMNKGTLDKLLMSKVDPRTLQDLVDIANQYRDAKNPFVQYEKETGEKIRRYSKKGTGPVINSLKYEDGEVNSCIDISHKYGHDKGTKKVILESLDPLRMDVYFNHKTGKYHLIGIKYADCKYENSKYVLNMDRYLAELVREKALEEGQSFADFEDLGIEFMMSFYKNDIIRYEKNGKIYTERFLSRTMPNQPNYIETKPIAAAKYEKRNLIGLSNAEKGSIKKMIGNILGDMFVAEKESFSTVI